MSTSRHPAISQTATAFAALLMTLVFIGFWTVFAIHLLHPCIGHFFVQVGSARAAT